MSYTIDGVPTGHHDYSLDQLDELSKSLRNEAGNGGEDIKVQRKSDLAKKAENKVANESAPRNPRFVQKLEGEERVQAETKKKQNECMISQIMIHMVITITMLKQENSCQMHMKENQMRVGILIN
jgi:hypothetical protein